MSSGSSLSTVNS